MDPAASPAATTLTGVIHGKTLELDQPTGLPDGERVSVVIQSTAASQKTAPGEGLRRSFGGWADDAEGLDEFLKEMRRSRDADLGRELEE